MRIRTQNGALLADSSSPAHLPFLVTSDWGYPRGGVGDLGAQMSMSDKIGTGAVGGVFAGISTAVATGSNVAGGIAAALTMAAPFAGPAAPFLLAAAALVGPIASQFKGCGETCIEATKIADQAGAALATLNQKYWAQPVHYRSTQLAFLASVDEIANYIRQACGNPALGPAGQRCISERVVRGGTAPWCPNPGHVGCDMYTTLYDPVANDPYVVPDPEVAVVDPISGNMIGGPGETSSLLSGGGGMIPMPLLLGGAALALLLVMGDK